MDPKVGVAGLDTGGWPGWTPGGIWAGYQGVAGLDTRGLPGWTPGVAGLDRGWR